MTAYPKFGVGPAAAGFTVTPSDTGDLPNGPCRSIYVGVTGDVTMVPSKSGQSVLFKAVPVGILPVQCSRIYATGTTATNIVALY